MAIQINLEKNGYKKKTFLGFSYTTFFFNFLVPFFRGDAKKFIKFFFIWSVTMLPATLIDNFPHHINNWNNKTIINFIILVVSFYIYDKDKSFYSRTILFTYTSCIFVVFICLAEQLDFNINKILYKIITSISLISYSIYLIHMEVLNIIIKWNDGLKIQKSIGLCILALIFVFLCSYISYQIIEYPFMKFRNRLTLNKK